MYITPEQKDKMREHYKSIIIIPIDTDKFNKDITEQIKAQVKQANGSPLVTLTANDEDRYKVRGGLGIVKGTNIVVDRELCGDILKGENPVVPVDIYHETVDAEEKTKSFGMFAVVTAKPTLNDLLAEYALSEVDMPTFMADRFAYNSRIVGNMSSLEKEIKKLQKK